MFLLHGAERRKARVAIDKRVCQAPTSETGAIQSVSTGAKRSRAVPGSKGDATANSSHERIARAQTP